MISICDMRCRRLLTVTIARKRLLCLFLAAITSFVILATLFTNLSIVQLQFDRSRSSKSVDEYEQILNYVKSNNRPLAGRAINPPRFRQKTDLNLLFNRPVKNAFALSEELYAVESFSTPAVKASRHRLAVNRRIYSKLEPVHSSFLKMDGKLPNPDGDAAMIDENAPQQRQPAARSNQPSIIYRDDSMHRIVHIDLKGAPPKLSYFAEFFPFIKKFGATGILIEYEDMFPFTGILSDIPAHNHYSHTDVKQILHLARENNLDIIPLVQTFGHLEYVLKLEQFKHLREEPLEPSTLCPSKPQSFDLVRELIDQIMAIHLLPAAANSSSPQPQKQQHYLHIGADEVWHLAKDQACRDRMEHDELLTPPKIFLAHVKRVAAYVKQKYPNTTIIMWDDMFHNMNVEDLKQSGIGDLLEPMVWSYYATWDKHLVNWDYLYPSVFARIWGATAFKGSTGETVIIPNVTTHALIHTSWLQALSVSARSYKRFQGLVLTGWQRYNHFSPLCELLPVSLPSLAVNLNIIRAGLFDPGRTLTEVGRQLGCTSSVMDAETYPNRAGDPGILQYDPLLNVFSGCKFPGARLNDVVHIYYAWHEKCVALHAFFVGYDGIVTAFQLQHGYVSPVRLMEKRPEFELLKSQYAGLRQELSIALAEVFDEYTVDEVLRLYMDDSMKRLLDEIEKVYEIGGNRTSWAKRPLNFAIVGGQSAKQSPLGAGRTDADAAVKSNEVSVKNYRPIGITR